MRLFNVEVFNDFVMGTGKVYTAFQFNSILASTKRLNVQVVANAVAAGGGDLDVTLEQSNDGRNWTPLSGFDAYMEVFETQTTVATGVLDGSTPPMRYARLSLDNTAAKAHVRITACGRGEMPKMAAAPEATDNASGPKAEGSCCGGCAEGKGCSGGCGAPAGARSAGSGGAAARASGGGREAEMARMLASRAGPMGAGVSREALAGALAAGRLAGSVGGRTTSWPLDPTTLPGWGQAPGAVLTDDDDDDDCGEGTACKCQVDFTRNCPKGCDPNPTPEGNKCRACCKMKRHACLLAAGSSSYSEYVHKQSTKKCLAPVPADSGGSEYGPALAGGAGGGGGGFDFTNALEDQPFIYPDPCESHTWHEWEWMNVYTEYLPENYYTGSRKAGLDCIKFFEAKCKANTEHYFDDGGVECCQHKVCDDFADDVEAFYGFDCLELPFAWKVACQLKARINADFAKLHCESARTCIGSGGRA